MTSIESIIAEPQNSAPSSEPVQNAFAALDERAVQNRGRLKHRVTSIIALQFLATIFAAIIAALLLPRMPSDHRGIEFKWDAVLITYQVLFGLQFVFVVAAYFIGLNSRWNNLKSTWRQTRFAAEVLRSLIHTRGIVDPLDPIVSRHDPVWHRFALSSGLSAIRNDEAKALDWEEVKTRYHRDRIEQQRDAYYRNQLAAASKFSAICEKIGIWAGALAPICLIFALYLKFAHKEWIAASIWSPLYVRFLPILLPLLAGTATSLKVVTDAGRRAERYKTQSNRLQDLSEWLPTLKTPSSIRRTVALTEGILLDELIEWYAASKNAGK